MNIRTPQARLPDLNQDAVTAAYVRTAIAGLWTTNGRRGSRELLRDVMEPFTQQARRAMAAPCK